MSQWLVTVGASLHHTVRISILLILAEHPPTKWRLMQLANKLDVMPGVVSYHLRDLLDAGLIEPAKSDRARDAVVDNYHVTEQGVMIINAARHAVQSRP